MPGRAAATFGIGPGDIERFEIAFLKTGVGDGANGPGFILLRITDPHHGMATIFDNDLADPFQKFRFFPGAHQGLIAVAERPEGAVEFLEFLLRRLRSMA